MPREASGCFPGTQQGAVYLGAFPCLWPPAWCRQDFHAQVWRVLPADPWLSSLLHAQEHPASGLSPLPQAGPRPGGLVPTPEQARPWLSSASPRA